MRTLIISGILAFASSFAATGAEQEFHLLRDLDTGGGKVAECRIGFRTFGALNAERSNVVLLPTWFGGKSADLEDLIGSGRMVDPANVFVIAVDALGNGVSCSPSNAAGAFPKITIAGMVESQRRLLAERFQVEKLYAVAGISMGGMQTFEWIVAYPDRVRKAVPVIGSPRLNAHDLLLWHAQLRVIRALEEAGQDPRKAMAAVSAMHQFAMETPARRAELSVEASAKLLANTAMAGAHDPRDWAAQLEAMIGHDVARGGAMEQAAARVQAETLVITAAGDHMVHPGPAEAFAKLANLRLFRLLGDCGHRAAACEAPLLDYVVREFLRE